jgi:hypothetical protein
MKLDLSTIYLRIAAILVPFAFGFLLYWQFRPGPLTAVLSAIALALVVIVGMLAVVSSLDAVPLVPSTLFEWQESIEYFVSIALGTVAGYAAAHASRRIVPPATRGGAVREYQPNDKVR